MDTIISYFLICWQKKFNYQGRARRLELGSFLLVTFIIAAGLQTIEMLIKEYIYPYPNFISIDFTSIRQEQSYSIKENIFSFHAFTTVYFIISLVPLFSVIGRRFQDLNKSKYWIFYLLFPVFLIFIGLARLMLFLYFGITISFQGEDYKLYTLTAFGVFLLYYIFLILKLLFQEGEPKENKYGKSPKQIEN
ncbi:DUF805 domain-containing protein [Rodentibacter trehalosifermentans]|uniref:DUF805 domain-containing protein n=1 Tax=Rodentibacter trehalosifermentans TaxID=1908263 RepID=A0A1V3J045_9PAST|nr:DUF805 domain-containing protein [Rodentibacter trehalosifermentans]OOF48235.1 hypothetical protein BKK52_06485 [Rodentibacter trehalosifermentans]OOF52289.1 hypothetical protein BKK53_06100 [Rodentibacter trehalosifermentans]